MIEARTDPNEAMSKLAFQADDYLHFLADSDWTDSQKIECVRAVWEVIVSFVDLGFGLSPLQQMLETKSLDRDSCDVLASFDSSKHSSVISATAIAEVRKVDS